MTPWTVAHQASPPLGFSRQEYWSGLPLPYPGDLPDPGIEPKSVVSSALARGSLLLRRVGSQALLGNILSLTFSNILVYSLQSNLVTLTPYHLPRTSQTILLEDLKTLPYLFHLFLFMCVASVCPRIYTVALISSITFSKLKVTKLTFEFHF